MLFTLRFPRLSERLLKGLLISIPGKFPTEIIFQFFFEFDFDILPLLEVFERFSLDVCMKPISEASPVVDLFFDGAPLLSSLLFERMLLPLLGFSRLGFESFDIFETDLPSPSIVLTCPAVKYR